MAVRRLCFYAAIFAGVFAGAPAQAVHPLCHALMTTMENCASCAIADPASKLRTILTKASGTPAVVSLANEAIPPEISNGKPPIDTLMDILASHPNPRRALAFIDRLATNRPPVRPDEREAFKRGVQDIYAKILANRTSDNPKAPDLRSQMDGLHALIDRMTPLPSESKVVAPAISTAPSPARRALAAAEKLQIEFLVHAAGRKLKATRRRVVTSELSGEIEDLVQRGVLTLDTLENNSPAKITLGRPSELKFGKDASLNSDELQRTIDFLNYAAAKNAEMPRGKGEIMSQFASYLDARTATLGKAADISATRTWIDDIAAANFKNSASPGAMANFARARLDLLRPLLEREMLSEATAQRKKFREGLGREIGQAVFVTNTRARIIDAIEYPFSSLEKSPGLLRLVEENSAWIDSIIARALN